jgi:uncharacterized membrane protein
MAVGIERGGVRGEPLGSLLRRNWQLVTIAVMALVGIGIGAYLTTEHYAKAEPFCPTVGPINCSSVLRSQYSVVPFTGSATTGIPITVPGALFFLVSGGLAVAMLVLASRGREEPSWMRPALALWSLAGLLFVLYLVYAEIVPIRAICLWCTGVHLLTLATFVLAFSMWQQSMAAQYAPVVRAPKSRTSSHEATRPRTTARVTQVPSRRAQSQTRRATSGTGKARDSRR